MQSLDVYIAADRRHALAHSVDLAERTTGAALFADVSGFTPLTEALVRAFGAQRGAEELPRQLNLIYDALIANVDEYGGSVIGFSGDAITCWFDDHVLLSNGSTSTPGALRAAACALDCQRAMQQFAVLTIPGAGSVTLAVKVAIAAGTVRRFVVGDPTIQLIDVLAGETLNRLADAEHHAERGEVVLDEAAVAALGEHLLVREWRADDAISARFAVVDDLPIAVQPTPWPALAPDALNDAQTRPWLLPAVYSRLVGGEGEFSTELRPAVALFLRFSGIDYDGDEGACHALDTFIRQAQRVVTDYDGSLIQLTLGDKGSYLYAAFGAPVAHEDDTVRAVRAAMALQGIDVPCVSDIHIGISQGRMRTGAYGGATRRTYGVLGDEVNMAARLMQHAPVGAVFASRAAHKASGDTFQWEPLPPLQVKGKSQPVTAFRLLDQPLHQAIRLHEPQYARPMVGRDDERALAEHLFDQALLGHGQIVGITGEAGMGKSRLVAELIRYASQQQIAGYGSACPSYGTNTSYLVWRTIWREFFGIAHTQDDAARLVALGQRLGEIDPALLPRLPLLGAALGIDIPDNDLTQDFDAKFRNEMLAQLLADCLRARANETPLLLVLEDCHWIDPLSRDLLDVVGRTIAQLPVLVVLSYRPPEAPAAPLAVSQLPHFNELPLSTLPADAVEALMQNKIVQLYGQELVVADDLFARIVARTEGNPFYIEELLNYLHDSGIDLRQPGAMERIDLPTSLHSLILSRIDRLAEDQRTVLKVASVVGRLFRVATLQGIADFLGSHEQLRRDMDALSDVELIAQDSPDPDLAYLFKHIITQEVAYESLLYATRATLHTSIGHYIERRFPDDLALHLDLLAYHYDRSSDQGKRREYLRRAGDAARSTYANAAAVNYYQRLLPLLEDEARCTVLLSLGQVFDVTGEWTDAHARYASALELAVQLGNRSLEALAHGLIGDLLRKQGHYSESWAALERARRICEEFGDQPNLAQVLHYIGTLMLHQGDYERARGFFDAGLALRREQNDMEAIGRLLSNLSIVAYHQGDPDRAWALGREGLEVRRTAGNKLWIANSLGNLGMLALEAKRLDEAQTLMEEALGLEREVGDRSAIALSLNNLGNVARDQGKYDAAHALYHESLLLAKDLGDQWALCYLLEDIGCLYAVQGNAMPAVRLAAAAAAVRLQINAPHSPPEQANLDRKLDAVRQSLGTEADTVWSEGQALDMDQAITWALERGR